MKGAKTKMKKMLSILLVLPILLIGRYVLAQEPDINGQVDTGQVIEAETADIESTIPGAGLTPDSPLYFLDTFAEEVSLALTRAPEKKAKKAFAFAEEKLAETQDSINKGKLTAADKAAKRYDKLLDDTNENIGKAKALGKDVDALATHVAEQTLKHIAVKQRVYDKLVAKGNLNAAEAVMKSIGKSLNGHERAVQAITKNKPNKEKLLNKGRAIKNALLGTEEGGAEEPETQEPIEEPFEGEVNGEEPFEGEVNGEE